MNNFQAAYEVQSLFRSENAHNIVKWGLFTDGYLAGIFPTACAALNFSDTQKKIQRTNVLPIPMCIRSPTYVNHTWKRDHCFEIFDKRMKKFTTVSVHERVGILDVLYYFVMQNPEIAARHPKLRETMMERLKSFRAYIETRSDLPKSTVLFRDYEKFNEIIKNRTDYVPIGSQFIEPPVSSTKKYNLRTNKKVDYKTLNGN